VTVERSSERGTPPDARDGSTQRPKANAAPAETATFQPADTTKGNDHSKIAGIAATAAKCRSSAAADRRSRNRNVKPFTAEVRAEIDRLVASPSTS
jgi:hypothetical protein